MESLEETKKAALDKVEEEIRLLEETKKAIEQSKAKTLIKPEFQQNENETLIKPEFRQRRKETLPAPKKTKRHPPVALYLTAIFGAVGIIIAAFIGGPVVAYRYFAMIYILLSTFLWVPLLWMLRLEGKTAAGYLLFLFSLVNLLVVLVPLGLSGRQ